jgi:hypothetical protein
MCVSRALTTPPPSAGLYLIHIDVLMSSLSTSASFFGICILLISFYCFRSENCVIEC